MNRKKTYDFVYLTNTPSFYKLNLCDKIAEKNSVLVVLYGYGNEAVNTVLTNKDTFKFDYRFIHEDDANKRNKLRTFIELLRLMRAIDCKRILYSGWLAPEYNLYSLISPRKKNVIVCESSIIDVSLSGFSGLLKRLVIRRMGAVLPSGQPHAALFEQLGFKGPIHITGGVGIFNKGPRLKRNGHNTPLRYLYIGRLVEVKNVEFLIEEFNKNGKPLTIVGCGILETSLKAKAAPNITFTGFIENEKLGTVYQDHDVFILPSIKEPWGLVVEEAIYWGLPVIVSNKVGCAVDMVENLKTGEKFLSNNHTDFQAKIQAIEDNYTNYKTAVENVDFALRDICQISAYTNLLK